jgi:hypothetical protein
MGGEWARYFHEDPIRGCATLVLLFLTAAFAVWVMSKDVRYHKEEEGAIAFGQSREYKIKRKF